MSEVPLFKLCQYHACEGRWEGKWADPEGCARSGEREGSREVERLLFVEPCAV